MENVMKNGGKMMVKIAIAYGQFYLNRDWLQHRDLVRIEILPTLTHKNYRNSHSGLMFCMFFFGVF